MTGLADDDRRDDRQHRQHAGREREQQAGEEEGADDRPERAAAQHRLDRTELAAGGRGRRGRRRRCQAGAAACSPALDVGERADDALAAEAGQADARAALHRRIAQARIGAALAGGDQAELGRRAQHRQGDLQDVAVGLDLLLEGLVPLDLAGRDLRGAEGCAVGRELELLAIEVVAGSDVERDLDRLGIELPGRELERLFRLEEVVGGERRLPHRKGSAGQQGEPRENCSESGHHLKNRRRVSTSAR